MKLTNQHITILQTLSENKSHAPGLGYDELAAYGKYTETSAKILCGELAKENLVEETLVNAQDFVVFITDAGEAALERVGFSSIVDDYENGLFNKMHAAYNRMEPAKQRSFIEYCEDKGLESVLITILQWQTYGH